jgi:hypothetical protein
MLKQQLTHSSLKANMEIPHKHQKEKENYLTLECIMDQRLIFVLIEDKQNHTRRGSKCFNHSNESSTYCLEVEKICTLCIAILEAGPLALQNQQYHGGSQLPTMMCNAIWPS